jgi:hypothetical protein
MSFCTKGYAEIHIQRLFSDPKKIQENKFVFEQYAHALVNLLYIESSFFENHQNLNFGGISKFFKQILFGQILLHWQWLRACLKQG